MEQQETHSYIALFVSHFGAIRFSKLCDRAGWEYMMGAVPRWLSSSCGTCVRYSGPSIFPEGAPTPELEQIVRVNSDDPEQSETVYSVDSD